MWDNCVSKILQYNVCFATVSVMANVEEPITVGETEFSNLLVTEGLILLNPKTMR